MDLNSLIGPPVYHFPKPVLGHGNPFYDIVTMDMFFNQVIEKYPSQFNLGGPP